jgi:hypothetical protein
VRALTIRRIERIKNKKERKDRKGNSFFSHRGQLNSNVDNAPLNAKVNEDPLTLVS